MRCDDKKIPYDACMYICMEHLKFGSHYVIERMRQLKGAGKSRLCELCLYLLILI
ncbi:hypothetical protein J3E69DRAFT_328335, partial [Trichoderma sp. SZMC 28015]